LVGSAAAVNFAESFPIASASFGFLETINKIIIAMAVKKSKIKKTRLTFISSTAGIVLFTGILPAYTALFLSVNMYNNVVTQNILA
jgi:amino acid permease